MSSDLESMITAAVRTPREDPGPATVWRRARRRAMARAVATATGVLGGLALLVGGVVEPSVLAPVIVPADGPAADSVGADGPAPDQETVTSWTIGAIGLTLEIPVSWDGSRADPLARSGDSGFVRLALTTGGTTVADVCRSEVERASAPYGPAPEVEAVLVDHEPACLVRPSGRGAALAVVTVPLPPVIAGPNGRTYLFVHVDARHLDTIVDSVRFDRP